MDLQNETYRVAQAMTVYGGSFHRALGQALQQADLHNQAKIKMTWAKDWQQFLELYTLAEARGVWRDGL